MTAHIAVRAGLALLLALVLGGCATYHVDAALGDKSASELVVPAQRVPVQLHFEFRTLGAPNARATTRLRDAALRQVQDSGLFTEVLTTHRPDAALLTISVDNVAGPGSENTAAKGVLTGATFFLVASNVTDHYVGAARYQAVGDTGDGLRATARHALHGRIGAIGAGPPTDALPAPSAEAAMQVILRQLIGHLLDQLSSSPAFPSGERHAPTDSPA